MNIELALLADYAAVMSDGKLMVAGIFERVAPPQMPWQHPSMHIALRVHVHSGEEGTHKIKIRLVDPDGTEIVALDADAAVEVLDPLDGGAVQFVLALNNVPFKTPGRHAFDIFLDGRFEHSVPLTIVPRPTPPAETTKG